jgi:hypothetical protein
MGEKTEARLNPDEAVAYFADILEKAVKPHANMIVSITKTGDIAAVVFEPDEVLVAIAQAWGWDGSSPVFRLSNQKRKEAIEHFRKEHDKVAERWFTAEQNGGRICLLVRGETLLLNITKEGIDIEPGSLGPPG